MREVEEEIYESYDGTTFSNKRECINNDDSLNTAYFDLTCHGKEYVFKVRKAVVPWREMLEDYVHATFGRSVGFGKTRYSDNGAIYLWRLRPSSIHSYVTADRPTELVYTTGIEYVVREG